MPTPNLSISVAGDAELALVYALTRTVGEFEARARLAETVGGPVGRRSAGEYRIDVGHLLAVLRELGFPAHRPDPEGEALTWLGDHYAISDGLPVLLAPAERRPPCATPPSLIRRLRG